DPRNRADGNSNAEEMNHCLGLAEAVAEYTGVDARNIALSGNGAYLIVPVDLENTPESRRLMKPFLEHLGKKFSNQHAVIDTRTSNRSRLCAFLGSVKYKSAATTGRPCRTATLRGYDPTEQWLEGIYVEPVDLRALLLADGIDLSGPGEGDRPRRS